jgi:hypothetical protein
MSRSDSGYDSGYESEEGKRLKLLNGHLKINPKDKSKPIDWNDLNDIIDSITIGWQELGLSVKFGTPNYPEDIFLLCRVESSNIKTYSRVTTFTTFDFENHYHVYRDTGLISLKFDGEHFPVGNINIKDLTSWFQKNKNASYQRPVLPFQLAQLIGEWGHYVYYYLIGQKRIDSARVKAPCPKD